MFIRATIGTAVTLEAPNNCRSSWRMVVFSSIRIRYGIRLVYWSARYIRGWWFSRRKTPLEELIYASNRFVFLNLLAIAEGIKGALFDAPHVAVTGKTGKGKTF